MELLLIEQYNKKRLMMARQEQSSLGNAGPTPLSVTANNNDSPSNQALQDYQIKLMLQESQNKKQAQAKAQQDLQRQQTQQMTMGNQMVGMTSQTNPMSLLQQPMQASPLNPQNLMQMSNSNMGNTQMAPQGNQPPQQGTSAAQQTQQPPRFNNADLTQISHIANTLMQNAPQKRIEQIQARFAKLNPVQQESVLQKVGNPVALHFRQEAQKIWLAEQNRQLQANIGNQRQNGMGVNPAMAQNFINPQQALEARQLRLCMAQAEAQAKAQQDLQRQQTQQMTMANQMGGMTSQTNPMSLLTQPVAQPGQPGGGIPQ
jgi:hypothetical protein